MYVIRNKKYPTYRFTYKDEKEKYYFEPIDTSKKKEVIIEKQNALDFIDNVENLFNGQLKKKDFKIHQVAIKLFK